ncbi:hypothetical protein NXY56_007690 [Leishmania guyanensis]|uniref:Secreted protein n=1 Tax=Leishmania guyanensis TaxID=5670 RepID=A0A1E1J9G3_LEIGU|nr:hypothetical protein, unknown function [Leishmania guyanensis]
MPFLRTFTVFCIIAGVLLQNCAALTPSRAVRPFETKFSSLSEACRGVLETECPPDRLGRADCLMARTEGNENHECKLWLSWRATCFAYAMVKLIPQGKCNFTSDQMTSELVLQCLRVIDAKELPTACSASPYFKSIMLHAPRRMDSDGTADL